LPAFKAGSGRSGSDRIALPAPIVADTDEDRERTERALAIWGEAADPAGGLGDCYFAHRGVLALARPAFGHALRFHPRCPFGPGVRVPCVVALVRDIRTDEPVAIHRTALSREGRNVEIDGKKRMALGPIRGGAVKLTPHGDVTTALGVAEGIESALSLSSQVPEFGHTPAWSLLSAGGIAVFPVLDGVETLWIAVDHDNNGVGPRAARTCSKRWAAAGREVLRVIPERTGADLNDLITKA
jgi:hypothetical protein